MKLEVLEPGASTVEPMEDKWSVFQLRTEFFPAVVPSWETVQLDIGFPMDLEIASLPDDRLRLINPLRAEIRQDDEGFVACVSDFNEYGYGEDYFEAVDDLREVLCELYWSLLESKGELSSDLEETVARLQKTILLS